MGDGYSPLPWTPPRASVTRVLLPCKGASLADALSDYFAQSEQLPTRLWLMADGDKAAGLLLQALPPYRRAQTQSRIARRGI